MFSVGSSYLKCSSYSVGSSYSIGSSHCDKFYICNALGLPKDVCPHQTSSIVKLIECIEHLPQSRIVTKTKESYALFPIEGIESSMEMISDLSVIKCCMRKGFTVCESRGKFRVVFLYVNRKATHVTKIVTYANMNFEDIFSLMKKIVENYVVVDEGPVKDIFKNSYRVIPTMPKLRIAVMVNDQIVPFSEFSELKEEEVHSTISAHRDLLREFVSTIKNIRIGVARFNRLYKKWAAKKGFFPNLKSYDHIGAMKMCGIQAAGRLRNGVKMYHLGKKQ
jgi:hypothetical protein